MIKKANPKSKPAIDIPHFIAARNAANPTLKEFDRDSVADSVGCNKALFIQWPKPHKFPKSIRYLFSLAELLGFDILDLIVQAGTTKPYFERMKVFECRANHVAGVRYVYAYNEEEARERLKLVWPDAKFQIIPAVFKHATILNDE